MTTIAYNHKDKEIAYDSRLTTDSEIYSDSYNKKITRDDVVYFVSGDLGDYDDFIDDFHKRKEAIPNLNCAMFMVENGVVYWLAINNGFYSKVKCVENDVIGSGYPYAIAAMDFGKTAKEAVQYASTRDCKTGGKVNTFKIEVSNTTHKKG